ncbi:MAG TPA: tetratricopeptide repeat protein, partial [Fimbriimonadaceae bacterium]|nr:tetratricopeptide repeat protein [Fimbriimonadaceae bacterium]
MSEVALRSGFVELLSEVRMAGKGASRTVLEAILDRFFPILVSAADPYSEAVMSSESKARSLEGLLAECATVAGQGGSTAVVDSTRESAWWQRGTRGLNYPVRRRTWILGMAGALAGILALLWLTGQFTSKQENLVKPSPPRPNTVAPSLPDVPKSPEEKVVRGGPDVEVRTVSPRKSSSPSPIEKYASLPPAGTLASVVGEPVVTAPGSGQGIPARPGMTVAYGSRLETGDFSKASLRFADGTVLEIDFNTVLVIPIPERRQVVDGHILSPRHRPDTVELRAGKLLASVVRSPDRTHFRVATSVATAEVLGTKFGLSLVKPDQSDAGVTAILQVQEGKVAFFNPHGRVIADRMMESSANLSRAPTEPKRIGTFGFFELSRPGHRLIDGTSILSTRAAWSKLVHPRSRLGIQEYWSPRVGLIVRTVTRNSPAAAAGILQGDTIVAVDGKPVETGLELLRAEHLLAGQKVAVLVLRNDVETRIDVESKPVAVPTVQLAQVHRATAPAFDGNPELALNNLLQLVTHAPSGQAHKNIGVLYEARDEMGWAIRHYQAAVRVDPSRWAYRQSLGEALEKIGNLDRALDEFRLAKSLIEPEAAWLHVGRIVRVLTRMGRLQEALKEVDVALQTAPTTAKADLLTERAEVLLKLRRPMDALRAIEEAAQLAPRSASVLSELAEIHHDLGNYDEAIKVRKSTVELEPSNAFYARALGGLLSEDGRLEEAEKILRLAVTLDAFSTDSLVALGLVLGKKEEYVESEKWLRKAIQLDDTNADAHGNLALTLKELGQVRLAESGYRKAIELDPRSPVFRLNLASLLMEEKRFAESESQFKKAIALNPAEGLTWTLLGTLYQEMGRVEGAAECYRKALEVDPNSAVTHNNVGAWLSSNKRYREAEVAFRKSIELGSKDSNPYGNLGSILLDANRLEEAEKILKMGVDLWPRDGRIQHKLGLVYEKARRYPEAEAEYLKSIRLGTKRDSTYYDLARFYFQTSRRAEAEKTLLDAIARFPNLARPLSALGDHYMDRLGRPDQASVYYERALRIEPKFWQARMQLAMSYFIRQKYNEAFAAWRQVVKEQPNNTYALITLAWYLIDRGESLDE